MLSNSPIGVFDSGVGGLTVVKALMERLPHENIIYFGDTARVPYGIKSVEIIQNFATQMTQFLLNQHVKMLVIACNTVAAVAAEHVTKIAGTLPVLNVIESGANAAVARTRHQSIGVVATLATVNSGAYEVAIEERLQSCSVYTQACPLFVPLVEEGLLDHAATWHIAKDYLQFTRTESIDTLLLGCTHYPLLTPLLTKLIGRSIYIVDPAKTVADEVASVLQTSQLLNQDTILPTYQFYVSDIPLRFQTIAERFLGCALPNLEVVRLD
ncbi:MAG: glutamate racemase [Neisseriales bacterium]|nr:MAG: glutamate racemase [Neisseriales bacterium]